MPVGNDYDFIDYGLFQDFVLIESAGPPKRVHWRLETASKPVFGEIDTVKIDKPVKFSLSSPTPGAEIYYTLDGSQPDNSSKRYFKPVTLQKSATVKAISFKEGFRVSPVTERNFYIVDKNNGLEYQYYEGEWEKLPEFEKLEVAGRGRTYDFNISGIERRQAKFAVEFNGYLKIENGGCRSRAI